MDGLSRLCRECDRVFHKAVTKRTHIRIPILPNKSAFHESTISSPFFDNDLNKLIEFIQEKHIGAFRFAWTLEYLMNTLCVLLFYVKLIFDDLRVLLIYLSLFIFKMNSHFILLEKR